MFENKIVKIISLSGLFLIIFAVVYFKYIKKSEKIKVISEQTEQTEQTEETEETLYSSNIITDVKYTSKDSRGNEYIITALKGEVDYSNPDIIYLTKVIALIKLKNSDNITINSDFGKYNASNFDTVFSKNVRIKYLDNNIVGEYVDFSIERNSIIISKNVTYTNLENILEADVIEMNLETKDTKIFMYEDKKKVNIKSKN